MNTSDIGPMMFEESENLIPHPLESHIRDWVCYSSEGSPTSFYVVFNVLLLGCSVREKISKKRFTNIFITFTH
jgi:hypothetical protein